MEGGQEGLRITEEGLEALGTVDPLPSGQALVEYWKSKLGKAERSILEVLVSAYPDSLGKETVAEAAGYAADGGGFNNALGRLRTLELIEGRGELRASSSFFEV